MSDNATTPSRRAARPRRRRTPVVGEYQLPPASLACLCDLIAKHNPYTTGQVADMDIHLHPPAPDDPNNDNHTTKPFTAATMSSRDRAPSDVPIGAENMSFYPSGLGSQMYTTSRMQNASVEGSGRPVSSVDSFVREPQRSAETSPTFNPIEITTGTRAETAVARAALMDSQDEMSKVKRIPNDVFASV